MDFDKDTPFTNITKFFIDSYYIIHNKVNFVFYLIYYKINLTSFTMTFKLNKYYYKHGYFYDI